MQDTFQIFFARIMFGSNATGLVDRVAVRFCRPCVQNTSNNINFNFHEIAKQKEMQVLPTSSQVLAERSFERIAQKRHLKTRFYSQSRSDKYNLVLRASTRKRAAELLICTRAV